MPHCPFGGIYIKIIPSLCIQIMGVFPFSQGKCKETRLSHQMIFLCLSVWSDNDILFPPPQLKIQFSTDSRVERMFEVLLDESIDKERKEKVCSTLD